MSQNVEGAMLTGVLEGEAGSTAFIADGTGERLSVTGFLPAGCRAGDRVCACADGEGCRVVKDFGSADEAEAYIKALLFAEGLDRPFGFDALLQAKQTAFTEITALMGRRVDLRGKTVITLSESESSRSECGFSVETDRDGNFILGLHTMDAAEFIGRDTALEAEAKERGKTVVLPDREIPMLPEVLTKGTCFFEVGEDRLAVSYFVTVDGEGRVLSFDFCESIVKAAANCLFDEIEALLLDFDSSAIMPLREAYASVLPTINQMFVLGGLLQNARVLAGGADIDRAERKFVYGRHGGKPLGVICQKESDPKRLIREFIAVTGRELASYLHANGIPALYRVQEEPCEEAVEDFRAKAEALGIDTAGAEGGEIFAYAAESCHGMRTEELLLNALHGALGEPGFSLTPVKHVVHGTPMYVRFAYPLNRFADFFTQRIVKSVIYAREHLAAVDTEDLRARAERACEAANRLEKRASRVESAVEDITAMECLRRLGAKNYTGLVSAVGDGWTEVLLDNGCTGYIERGKGGLSFGSEVTVRFERADFREGRLYLSL